jgi:hypothetical protein
MFVSVPGFEALLRRGEAARRVVLEASEHGCVIWKQTEFCSVPLLRVNFKGTTVDIHLTSYERMSAGQVYIREDTFRSSGLERFVRNHNTKGSYKPRF